MIHVRELTKTYADLRRGPFTALAGLSFDARPGQIYGLLGPNGAGKTTALRILSTVLRPTSGDATVNGYDVVTQPDLVRHQIGFVSCNTAVYDRMTAWEMVEWFGYRFITDAIFVTYDDTIGDMMAGGAGALAAGVLASRFRLTRTDRARL